MTTAIIDTSTANIASVRFALERLGVTPVLARTPEDAAGARRLVLPGVGAAGAAMTTLQTSGWVEALQSETRPVLGVCLGMQLLFEHSEEGDATLLGLIPGRVRRLDPQGAGPWPHMGWNQLEDIDEANPLLTGVTAGERAYFVHGYFVEPGPFTCASARYGEVLSAAVSRGAVAGCQFHPERSGQVGARILANFLQMEPA